MSVAPQEIVDSTECVHGAMHLSVENNKYHALPGTSSSNIRDIADDVQAYMHGNTEPHAESDAKLLGAAAHCYILQPELFDIEYAVYLGKVRRGKQWDEFVEEQEEYDKEIITKKMYERCIGMRDSLDRSGYGWLWSDEPGWTDLLYGVGAG